MSRIGKKPIKIPAGVEVKVEGNKITAKGPKGEAFLQVAPELKIESKEGEIVLSLQSTSRQAPALWGLFRVLAFNLINGVSTGFEKKLEIEGVGYRATLDNEDLVLAVGYSHPVRLKVPEGLKVAVEKNVMTVSGFDKGAVGQFSANIRKVKPCEPYKGKGIKYQGEHVRRKVGKKVVATKG